MTCRNYVRVVIFVQVFILVSRSYGQYWTNKAGAASSTSSRTQFVYPTSAYYPSYGFPGQPYGYAGPYVNPSQLSATLYSPSMPSASLTRPQNSTTLLEDWRRAQQQYYLGPMNAAQANYLIAHVNSLMQYGNNLTTAPQILSTPTLNASSILTTLSTPTHSATWKPTPQPTIISPETTTTRAPLASSQPTTQTFTDTSAFLAPDEQQTSTHTVPLEQRIVFSVNDTGETNCSLNNDSNNTTSMSHATESSERNVRATAQLDVNPFVQSPSYRVANWQYNPAVASFSGNLPPRQPYYPPGFGPWNPFVLSPVVLPIPQPNITGQEVTSTTTTTIQGGQENRSGETPSFVSSAAEAGPFTNMDDLPPQVKEFIDMIPDILSMPESSQLNPSTGDAIIHQLSGGINGAEMGVRQLGGGSTGVTSLPKSRDPKSSLRFKKRRHKLLRHHD